MKDIKELIYAAVEENALKFQEIVNNQLQVRAYEAIESLRPEIGASMFGEAKECDDEEDEDEDEEEMDDKKKSMKEALHPNQQKIDVVDDEKIDAKDFAKLRKTKNEETQKNIFRNPNLPAKDQLKNPPKKIKVEEEVAPSTSQFHVLVHKSSPTNVEKAHHAVSGAGNRNFRPGTGLARMDKPGGSHDPTGGDHHVIHAPDHATHENLRKNLSDYGARATIVDTHTGKREDVHEEAQRLKEMSDDERRTELKRFGKKAAETHGYDHPGDEAVNKASSSAVKSELKAVRHFVAGRDKPYRSPANEEVEQVNERSREDLTSQIKGLKKTAIKHGYDWPHDDSTDNVSTKDLKTAHKSIRSVIKKDLKADVQEVADKVVADKVRTRGSFKFFSKKKLPGSDKSSMNEVAMPKNAADWQALITHQIQTTGHPVATDAQFRAQNCKDTSKIASLEPGKDALQYATAQGGTVKLP